MPGKPPSLPVRSRAAGALERIDPTRWAELQRIAETLRSLGTAPLTRARAEELAKRLGVHAGSVYRYRRRLILTDELTSVAGRTRGWKPERARLLQTQTDAIDAAIETLRRRPGPLRLVDLVEEVNACCRALRISAPSRPSIDRRLRRTSGVKVHRRGVAPPGEVDPLISPGSFRVRSPLDVVQIDHTTMDIEVVDPLYRQPLGRPWLTLATDVASRCVVGFVISFVPPSAATVSLCVTVAVADKAAWMQQLAVDASWPMSGLPKVLHLDGAAEFKSKALRRGCAQYGIDLAYRERPHHGGHVERLIGTFMSQLKQLPGATGGSPKARRSYRPEAHAALTLSELEAWFAQAIMRYHHSAHRGLKGATPTSVWALQPPPAPSPESLRRFRVAFLPAVSRMLRRDGINFCNLRYWHPLFAQWVARHERLVLHFDPRDLSRLYLPHGEDFLEVPFADLRHTAVSLWEAQAAARHLRESGNRALTPALLIEAVEAQRAIVRSAKAKTRTARRARQLAERSIPAAADPLHAPPATTPSPDIDWGKPAQAFDGETWPTARSRP